jgi:hypothetical protein
MRSMTVGSGAGAVNAVVLASAIVPPLVVLLVFRIGWTWSQNDHGDERLSLRQLMRRAFWFERAEADAKRRLSGSEDLEAVSTGRARHRQGCPPSDRDP